MVKIGDLGWWFGIRIGVPPSKNPFHKGIRGMQTTNPNHQLTIKHMKFNSEFTPEKWCLENYFPVALEVQPPFFIGWFPNHHYSSRGLSSSKRNHHF